MNSRFDSYITLGRGLVEDKGLSWDISIDRAGKAAKGSAWNLTEIVGGVARPIHYLSNLGADKQILDLLSKSELDGPSSRDGAALSRPWQDLIKAAVAEQLLLKRNSTGHVVNSILRPLRVLATVTGKEQPWELTAEHVAIAVKLSRDAQECGKLADLVVGLVKTLFDEHHLTDTGPLYPLLAAARLDPRSSRRAKYLKSTEALRESLEEKKRAERLPSNKALWELVRIVMTEQPLTFMDELRFAAVRLMIFMGFRIGEATLLPLDWRREKIHLAPSGRSAGQMGGVGRSVLIRHFAEKQNTDGGSSLTLCAAATYVPQMFEKVLGDTLDRVTQLTDPLRRTLRSQIETGRLLPWHSPNALVPMLHLYPHLTGNPFWTDLDIEEQRSWMDVCRLDPSGSEFDRLFQKQAADYRQGYRKASEASYMYFHRMRKDSAKSRGVRFRRADGSEIGCHERLDWRSCFLRIDELEMYLREAKLTKLTDLSPLSLESGEIQTWELMFIYPKRSVAEERSGGICDLTRYMAIGRPGNGILDTSLGELRDHESLFQRYGYSDEDKSLVLRSHMLRHLQNNELFRLGVADTFITKKFGRRSVNQSYEYDHRTLAEELEAIEIPLETEFALGDKTATVYKMIKAERASGPIVDEFRKIQADEGDDAAFSFLRAEADGFHATPYGLCVSSFTVSPCPKHLQCFNGCRHLTSSPDPGVQANLRRLEIKLIATVDEVEARESKSIGRQNQLDHARQVLNGVRALLQTEPGAVPFPDGKDLSAG